MKNIKLLLFFLTTLVLVTNCEKEDDLSLEASDAQTQALASDRQEEDLNTSLRAEQVEGRYIVVFKDGAEPPVALASQMEAEYGFTTRNVYEHAIRGFSAEIPQDKLAALRENPQVAFVEPDFKVYALQQTVPTGVRRIQADQSPTADIDGSDDVRVDVDVAILDTGIDEDHPDLNVVGGVRFFNGGNTDGNFNDTRGHGTHVAGTVGALDNGIGVVGVAPGARLWAVKVLSNPDGTGFVSDVIRGIDWVTANASTIEVANMSLGGQGFSQAQQNAIQSSVAAGVVYVVAAGNSNANVYGADGQFGTNDDFSPASLPEVMTISSMNDSDGIPGGLGAALWAGDDDSFASYSNYSNEVVANNPVNSTGAAIDLILPGTSILSTIPDGQYGFSSGTSMASPHAAGLAALYIAENGRANNASEVYSIRQALINRGVAQDGPFGLNQLNDPDDNPENLGWVPTGSGGPQDPIANAGEDQTVTDSDGNGSETVTLDGSGSNDPDGSIVSYEWDTDGDGNADATGVSPDVTFNVGATTVTLTVTDDSGATDTDQVVITVNSAQNNQSPVADAGPNQTVTDNDNNGSETVTLDGSGSNDPDGTIASYEWDTDGDGTTDATGATPSVTLGIGTTTITLTVTDDAGATDTDQVTITVEEGVQNNDVVADAGPDQTVADSDGNGSESVTLDGSNSTTTARSMRSYEWDFDGDGQSDASGAVVNGTFSVGVHIVTLTVTDGLGRSDTDQATITVTGGQSNQAPTADAGNNQTVTDSDGNGSESVTLNGGGSSDPDGTIVSYAWDVDGNGTTDATGVSPTVSFPVGTTTVTLTVTDNDGATDSDQVTITVNAGQSNQAPTANAGSNQTVTDNDGNGSESVTLNGSGSNDPDGTIVSYAWDVDGNGTTDATGVSPTVSFPVGTNTVTLTVTDNDGASDTDQVTITVEEQPNAGPISVTGISPDNVDAGNSVTVTITGSGFASGASVALLNGNGFTPQVSNITVVNSSTITATIQTRRGRGRASGSSTWDVRVTNLDGNSDTLIDGFTVN